MRGLGRLLQKMKPVAVEQRFVPCQVPLSPLIYFLTVLLALWAFIPFTVLMETGNKRRELITKSGFVLRRKKPQQARHNRGRCCAALLWAVCILWKEHLTKIVGNALWHGHEEPVIGQSGKDKGPSGGDVLRFTNSCQPRLDTWVMALQVIKSIPSAQGVLPSVPQGSRHHLKC